VSCYCLQCSVSLFRYDARELAGLITAQDVRDGLTHPVICEGCGPTFVDHKGKCVSDDCPDHGERAA
jgi:hypothetical protein